MTQKTQNRPPNFPDPILKVETDEEASEVHRRIFEPTPTERESALALKERIARKRGGAI